MKRNFFYISILFGFQAPALDQLQRLCAETHFTPLLSLLCVIPSFGIPAAILITWGLISREYPSHQRNAERT